MANGDAKGTVEKSAYGVTADGREVDCYTLTNAKGVVLKAITFGATVTELHVPDRDGQLADVVLGFDNLAAYETDSPYFGCAVGRCANRIGNARFTLDGQEYVLANNDGDHHLHGGTKGFDKAVWKAETFDHPGGPAIRFVHHSLDGDENYPGNLDVEMYYLLTNRNEFRIEYSAACDKPTPVNLTNHSYFNLAGKGDILNHLAQINSEQYTTVDHTLIPTGALAPLAGTPLDFAEPRVVGERLAEVGGDPRGYDHNYVLKTELDPRVIHAVTVVEPESGRQLGVHTDQPGIQFYSGNFLDGTLTGKGGRVYERHAAFCLETQRFPDSPNQPTFPSAILRPGETYRHICVYTFSTI